MLSQYLTLATPNVMNYEKMKPSKKLPLLAYVILLCYICISFVNAWLSSDQNKIALQIREDFEQQKNQLIDEIHALELEEAALTSAERIHKFAQKLRMVQPSDPVHVLRDE